MSGLPPRLPIGDVFIGSLIKVNEHHLLVQEEIEGITPIAHGQLTVRYAIVFLGRSNLSIVPDLVALDTGGAMNGEDAWDFLFHKSNLFPRADVLGFRHDGVDDMVTVKSLDLMYPIRLLVYADDSSRQPLAQAVAVIASDLATLPPRIAEYSNYYPTLNAWQKAQNG